MMTYAQVRMHQKEQGNDQMQHLIDSGLAWKLEGAIGRAAMDALESGACMLPKQPHKDAYGNTIPSRDWLKAGTKGTFQNSVRYYQHNQW